jgi:glutamyl-tRNA reductase
MLVSLGINHRSAPLEVLERCILPAGETPKLLDLLISSPSISEAVVVSTCNRTEVYLSAEKFHSAYQAALEVLGSQASVEAGSLGEHCFVSYDDDVVAHLFEVASGLDSVVLGEHQILGQVRNSWLAAKADGATGPNLNLLFQRALECGKRARSETAIGQQSLSMPHAVTDLIKKFATAQDLKVPKVLLVGAGDFNSEIATAVAGKLETQFFVSNRTKVRAESLANKISADVVDFKKLASFLPKVDVAVCATGAVNPVISYDDVVLASSPRRQKLLLDLALPRDISAKASSVQGIRLVTLADLQRSSKLALDSRRSEVAKVKKIIATETVRFRDAFNARSVASFVADLYGKADEIREAEVNRFSKKLADLDADQLDAIDSLTKALVAKLLHGPTIKLKENAGTEKGERLIMASRELFDFQ